MDTLIRCAKPEDWPQIESLLDEVDLLHRELYPDRFHKTEESFRERAWITEVNRNAFQNLLIAEEQKQILGMIYLIHEDVKGNALKRAVQYLHIDMFVVREDQHRRGIGRQLYHAALAWGRERDLDKVELTVYSLNKRAYDFYKQMGFQAIYQRLGREL